MNVTARWLCELVHNCGLPPGVNAARGRNLFRHGVAWMERRDAMEQIETLREQASIIRSLAQSFDQPVVRADLLILAMRCEEMAEEAESEITERRARVIDG
jgi:hypothetical protein